MSRAYPDGPAARGGPVACTIVAKAWLPYARVLARSFQVHHPGIPFLVLLADRAEGRFDPAAEPFGILFDTQLHGQGLERLRFLCDPLAYSYALTPFLVRHLLEQGYGRVIFLKQESLVMGSLAPEFARLAEKSVVLTPHLLQPLSGPAGMARECDTLLAGAYNAGLVGVSDSPEGRRFVAWWADRVGFECQHDVGGGMHFEQRWLDLAPAYFDGVELVRDPGCNVGHWHLPERHVSARDGRFTVDGHLLRLFRFSGYDPFRPGRATRYFDRLEMAALGDAALLFVRARALLLAAGLAETCDWPYGYARFDNGVPVFALARDFYRAQGEAALRFGDPLATRGSGSFFAWMMTPVDAAAPTHRLTQLWLWIYRQRPDLGAAFPDVLGVDRAAFLAWTLSSGLAEHGIPDCMLGHECMVVA